MDPETIAKHINATMGYTGYREQWGIKPGEDLESWDARVAPAILAYQKAHPGTWAGDQDQTQSPKTFLHMHGAVREGIASLISVGQSGGNSSTAPGAAGSSGGPLDRNKATDDFYRMMMNPNDPSLLAAQDRASAKMGQTMAGRGLQGGLSQSTMGKAGMDSRNSLLLQRQGLGMAAIQQGIGFDIARQSNAFDQKQSNDINQQNRSDAQMQGLVSAGGKIVEGLSNLAKKTPDGGGAGTGTYYGTDFSGATSNVPAYPTTVGGGAGGIGMNPNELNSWPGGSGTGF